MVVVVVSDGRSYDRDWAETIIISFGPDKRARTREQANRLGEVESRDFFPPFFSLFSLPPFSFSRFLSQPFLPSDERRSRARRSRSNPAGGAPLYSSLIFNAPVRRPASAAGKRITYFDRPCSPRNSTITRFDAREG